MEAVNNPEDPSFGTRQVPFTPTLHRTVRLYGGSPQKFFRLGPGREVRLRYGFFITCQEVIKDDDGNIIELRCTYDPETRAVRPGWSQSQGTIHWVSADMPWAESASDHLFKHKTQPMWKKDSLIWITSTPFS